MGQIPYGYRIENGAAVIIPAEAAQIRLIFQNYIAGMSLQSAARAENHARVHSDCQLYPSRHVSQSGFLSQYSLRTTDSQPFAL